MIGALAMAFPSAARAGTITISSTDFQGYGGKFFVAGVDSPPFVIGSVVMTDASGLGGLDALQSFESFCVDFGTGIDLPGVYNATVDNMTAWQDGSRLEADGSAARAAWLYQEFAPRLSPIPEFPGDQEAGLIQRAALQMAIWNALYDSDFTVSANDDVNNRTYFTSVGDHPDVLRFANEYLQGTPEVRGLQQATQDELAAAALNTSFLQLRSLDNTTDVQDFIGPAHSVPEPGSLLLLGTGLAALTAFRRKALRG